VQGTRGESSVVRRRARENLDGFTPTESNPRSPHEDQDGTAAQVAKHHDFGARNETQAGDRIGEVPPPAQSFHRGFASSRQLSERHRARGQVGSGHAYGPFPLVVEIRVDLGRQSPHSPYSTKRARLTRPPCLASKRRLTS
jgi:hypothetical protein